MFIIIIIILNLKKGKRKRLTFAHTHVLRIRTKIRILHTRTYSVCIYIYDCDLFRVFANYINVFFFPHSPLLFIIIIFAAFFFSRIRIQYGNTKIRLYQQLSYVYRGKTTLPPPIAVCYECYDAVRGRHTDWKIPTEMQQRKRRRRKTHNIYILI